MDPNAMHFLADDDELLDQLPPPRPSELHRAARPHKRLNARITGLGGPLVKRERRSPTPPPAELPPPIKWIGSNTKSSAASHKHKHTKSGFLVGYTLEELIIIDTMLRQPEGQYMRLNDINRIMRNKHDSMSVPVATTERYLLILGWQMQWKYQGCGGTSSMELKQQHTEVENKVRTISRRNRSLEAVREIAIQSQMKDVDIIAPELLQQWMVIGVNP